MQICKAGLEVASGFSLLRLWEKAWLCGCLQGEDNSACNFLSQSINSHCGGRRKKLGLYMHFDVPRWDTILKAEFFQATSASFGPQLLLLFSHFAVPLWSLGQQSWILGLGTQGTFLFQTLDPKWILDFFFVFLSGCVCVSRRGIKRAACPGKSRKEHVEGSSAPGEELVVSDTQVSVSQQPNAIAKSQPWSKIALAGLLCVQDAGNNHFIGLSDGETQQEKCALF